MVLGALLAGIAIFNLWEEGKPRRKSLDRIPFGATSSEDRAAISSYSKTSGRMLCTGGGGSRSVKSRHPLTQARQMSGRWCPSSRIENKVNRSGLIGRKTLMLAGSSIQGLRDEYRELEDGFGAIHHNEGG